jgi:hypothetical protein
MLRLVADERPNVDLDVNLNLNATVDVDVVGPNIGVEVFTAAKVLRARRVRAHDPITASVTIDRQGPRQCRRGGSRSGSGQRQRVLPAVRFTTKQ